MMMEPQSEPTREETKWKAWDAFLESTPETGFMQSSWWADFRTTAGYDHFAAILKNQGTILGGAVVMKYPVSNDRFFYYIPEGPVLPADQQLARQVFEAILEEIERRRREEPGTVSHLRMEPRWQILPEFVTGFRLLPPFQDRFTEPRDTLCINLRLTEEALLLQMKPKGRYNIKVAEKHGVRIVEDPSSRGVTDFIRIYEETTARHGMNPKPPEYFEDLITIMGSVHHGSVFFAEYKGRRIAGAIVVYFGKRATYFFGASQSADRQVMAPYLLHFEIMKQAKARGYEWYDFWGIAPATNPDNHPWSDITTFKRKFGGKEVNLVSTMDHVFDNDAYADYVAEESNPEIAGVTVSQ